MSPKKPEPKAPAPLKWYELERLVPYRDLVLVLGALLTVIGVMLVFVPAALIVAGVGLVYLSWRMAK